VNPVVAGGDIHALDAYPPEIQETAQLFAAYYLPTVGRPDQLSATQVGYAMHRYLKRYMPRSERYSQGWADDRKVPLERVALDYLAGTYEEFRAEAGLS
jgi:hypothetical protein